MEEEKGSPPEGLKRFLLSQIEKKGAIPFVQFMEWCLYHETYGYYQSNPMRIGKEGDYYTGPNVHPVFGAMIAKQICQMVEILGRERFEIVEIGGAQGYLCEDILQWMKIQRPDCYTLTTYYLIEQSLAFQRLQKERLAHFEREGKLFWRSPEILETGENQFTGCFLSNELIDAFPVHRVVMTQGELKEIYVTQEEGELKEVIGPPSTPELITYFNSFGIRLGEGQHAEVNLYALNWIEKVSRCLRKGFVITIDYGYLAEELYAPSRYRGTLLCYHRHRTSENPYERIGEQDLTSHVNFTALIRKGEEVGLRFTGFVPQYRFLLALGLLQELDLLSQGLSEQDRLELGLTVKHLIEPEVGMGEVFKVLIQHKGIDHPSLDGLRDLRTISLA